MTTPDRTPDDRTRTVEIPDRTADRISKRLQGTEFESIEEYVGFALDLLLRELDHLDQDTPSNPDTTTDEASVNEPADEVVADRLESLGYL